MKIHKENRNLKNYFFIFFVYGFQAGFAQGVSSVAQTVFLTPSTASPTCVPTVIGVPTSFSKNYVEGHYYVVRNQEEWNRYVNFPEKEIARVNFDKKMLVIFPFYSPPGESRVHIKVSSACVLPDHIQINYSIVGYRHLKPNRTMHLRSIAVVLPNLNLPVVAVKSDDSEN